MKKIPVLPNIITAFALTCGLFVIFKTSMLPLGQAQTPFLSVTAGILLLAALADVMDGAVARILKSESFFGGFFDSLADAVSFGVAPSVIVLKTLSIPAGTFFSFLMTFAAMIYTVSGVLRLVRFNVMALQPKEEQSSGQKHFTGLPIPAAAAALVSLNLFLVSDEMESLSTLSEDNRGMILFFSMVVLGYFMISRWKFFSLKTLHIRVASFRMVFLTVIVAVLLFYGILNHFPVTFLILSWGYIFLAWILSIVRVIAGRRNQALEDFEPEKEEDLE